MSKAAVFGSFVVDLMARSPRLPVPGETVKGSVLKWDREERDLTRELPPIKQAPM